MKTFQCTHCHSLVFFNDLRCMQCGHDLGFDPDSLTMCAVTAVPAQEQEQEQTQDAPPQWWQVAASAGSDVHQAPARFRFCLNHTDHQACNFLVDADDPQLYCVSCRQTRLIPNLAIPGNLQHWATIEQAKRRLYYTLARLGLEGAAAGAAGVRAPVYEFREDIPGEPPVMTGHDDGLITLNIAEADDAERTRRRVELHEPYRTLLGHLRHEIGHYYWDEFFLNDPQALEAFRQRFGDESLDYGQALQQHYQQPRTDWAIAHISSYATSHPWEDWAETWAHYLHLMDLLEIAASYRLSFELPGPNGPTPVQCQDPYESPQTTLPDLLSQGMGVSLVLNSLNRSLGQEDAYPFVLSTPVLDKLAFVHDIVQRKRTAQGVLASPSDAEQAVLQSDATLPV